MSISVMPLSIAAWMASTACSAEVDFGGGACGGAYVVAAKVGMTAVGLTGIPGMAIVQPMSLIHYIIGLVIAFGAAFAASYLLKYKVE